MSINRKKSCEEGMVQKTDNTDELEVLKMENSRLQKLTQQDSLTGLLNRRAIESEVNKLLTDKIPGVFLMMDIDEFKYINDKYGHLTGDRTLVELSRIMELCFFRKDLIGRIGGDEFAVFMPGEYKEDMIKNKVGSLNSRFKQAGQQLGINGRLCVTVGAEFSRDTDSFQTLYEKADIAMRIGKKDWNKALNFYKPTMKTSDAGMETRQNHSVAASDIKAISLQLREEPCISGENGSGAVFFSNCTLRCVYCQNYDVFISVYRFLVRGLSRTGSSVHMILVSMTDQDGVFISLDNRAFLMEKLRESLCSSLRSSDIYTRYSSCQFLAMLPGAALENMNIITTRIQNSFRVRVPDREDLLLSFSFYPLQPLQKDKCSTNKET